MTKSQKIRRTVRRIEGGPTAAQIKFIEGLLFDCGFVTRMQRNGYLSRILKDEIKYIDDMAKSEASSIIMLLQDRKRAANMGYKMEDE